jgi:hypothetical protein
MNSVYSVRLMRGGMWLFYVESYRVQLMKGNIYSTVVRERRSVAGDKLYASGDNAGQKKVEYRS